MKVLTALLFVLATFKVASAQPSPAPQIRYVTADPTGQACSNTAIALLTPTGSLYTCQSGIYAAISGGGGGGGTVCSTASTSSNTVTANFATSPCWIITLNDSGSTLAVSGAVGNGPYTLASCQDPTGSRAWSSFASSLKGFSQPALTPSTCTYQQFTFDGTNFQSYPGSCPLCVGLNFTAQTDASTVTWAIGGLGTANASLTFTTHGGSRTLNITGPANGGSYVMWMKQDGTGGEGLTLGTGCTWKVSGGGSGAITPSTGANAVDVLAFTYDGVNCYANFNKNFN